MKIGVLGTGFGMVHLKTFQNHPLVNELVFFSRTQGKVDEVSAKLGLRGTTNMDDILCDPSVDVVTIALPHALHARTAIRAMEQGKDVICEVPVCPTLEEAEQLAQAARRTGRRVFVDLFSRFAPAHRFLREKIKSGEYRCLLSLQVVNRCAPVWGPVPLGLDVLPLESCSCDFDWLSWCLGALTLSGVNAIEVERRAACIDLLLTGLARLPIQMTCSTLMPLSYGVRERIEATFERAAVEYRETSWSQGSDAADMVVYDAEGARTVALPQADPYYDSLTYSLERIRDGQHGITDLQEALPALKLALELSLNVDGAVVSPMDRQAAIRFQ